MPNNGGTATYQGCRLEGVGGRALSGNSFMNMTGMTNELCATFCAASQSAFFGTEYAQGKLISACEYMVMILTSFLTECYCGNSISTATDSQSQCSAFCTGDNTEFCGGNSHLSVWSLNAYGSNAVGGGTSTGGSGSTATTTASVVPAATSIAYIGCYAETSPSRALTALYNSGTSMTVDLCAQKAQALNLAYFGLEYASQCLAGSVLSPASTPLPSPASHCSMKCAGNSSETCGGSNVISLYNNTQYIKPYNPNPVNVPNQPGSQYRYLGCYTEGTGARALGSTSTMGSAALPATTSLTVETCAAYCFSKGYSYMGVEDANLCFCNAAGPINSATLSAGGDADCNMTCAGNATEWCGAANTLNVYRLKSASARFAGSTGGGSNSTAERSKKRGLRFRTW